ncbi:triple QxxK/R motif-containing protein isoform X1 [Narcine bancroftii]|uniref:triple QxxK/R motif-containing protein isoform X1 n=1 Tax=Narcine bancroftii TaxID=1343680 RepID=UPI00383167E7
MGRKDASASKIPIDYYRKQIGKQDYKKTKSILKATRLKAEAKKIAPGIRVMYKNHQEQNATTDPCGTPLVTKFQAECAPFTITLCLVDVTLIIAAILILLVAVYGFFYLKLTTEVDLDPNLDQ